VPGVGFSLVTRDLSLRIGPKKNQRHIFKEEEKRRMERKEKMINIILNNKKKETPLTTLFLFEVVAERCLFVSFYYLILFILSFLSSFFLSLH